MLLTTDRLTIRSFRPGDVPDFARIAADPEVMRYLGGPVDAETASAYVFDCIARDRATGISRYAVARSADGALLGFCGFKHLEEDAGGQVPTGTAWTDFGWRYRQSAWNQGYGTEAALAVYAWGTLHLELATIEARAHEDNVGSWRIIEKLGFVRLDDYETTVGPYRRYREPGGRDRATSGTP